MHAKPSTVRSRTTARCHLEAKPLRAIAEWVEEYERFWNRNLDSLGSYLAKIQRKPPPKRKRKSR